MKKLKSAAVAACAVFASAAAAAPGTDDDPLVSKSYIDSVVYPYIDNAVASGSGGVSILNLKKGQSLYGQAGTELIVRGGTAEIIATSKGGVCDVTSGFDVADGIAAHPNHLHIVPVADGRGLRATSDAIIMVRGSYEVK